MVRLAVVLIPCGTTNAYFQLVLLLVAENAAVVTPLSAKVGACVISSLKLAVNVMVSPPLKKFESLSHSSSRVGEVVS